MGPCWGVSKNTQPSLGLRTNLLRISEHRGGAQLPRLEERVESPRLPSRALGHRLPSTPVPVSQLLVGVCLP